MNGRSSQPAAPRDEHHQQRLQPDLHETGFQQKQECDKRQWRSKCWHSEAFHNVEISAAVLSGFICICHGETAKSVNTEPATSGYEATAVRWKHSRCNKGRQWFKESKKKAEVQRLDCCTKMFTDESGFQPVKKQETRYSKDSNALLVLIHNV